MRLHLIVFIYLATGSYALAAPPTAVRLSPALTPTAACEAALTATLEQTLRRVRSRWGSAYFGTYDDLERSLRRAGVRVHTAARLAAAVDETLGIDLPDDSLRDLACVFTKFVSRRQLIVGVMSADCSLSTRGRAVAVGAPDDVHAVILLPLPTATAEEFVVDFWAAQSGLAADRLLELWLDALSPRHHGDFDQLAHRPHFDLLFRTLYKLHQREELESWLLPERTERERQATLKRALDQLRVPAGDVGRLMDDLRLEPQNVLTTARHLIDDMRATIRRAR